MADLTAHQDSPTVQAIYRWHESRRDDGFRAHLGASVIGRPCSRQIWYGWRWWLASAFTGRMLRLFESGQLAEGRFIRELRGIGAEVWPVDPSTGRQWTVSAHGGHFGGSLDAVCKGLPESKRPHVCEFKTHNAKSFATLTSKGVKTAKPEHWCQANLYAHMMDLERVLYLAVGKDNDALYSERWHTDHDAAEQALGKAERIIYAWTPPARISDDPAYYICQWCDVAYACQGLVPPDKNCRTCRESRPHEDGTWRCGDVVLDVASQRAGCERWEAIG